MLFKDLNIGDQFKHSTPACYPRTGYMETIWVKVSKSRAECINQINYGNNRHVGSINPYAPNTHVSS